MTLRKFCCTASVFGVLIAALVASVLIQFRVGGIPISLIVFIFVALAVITIVVMLWHVAWGICEALRIRVERWRA